MIKIAIDGPSGGGKSTLAKKISRETGIIYVDTGALYRTVGYYVRGKGVSKDDRDGVIALLPEIKIELVYKDGNQTVLLNGEDLGDKIREPEISMYASAVSAVPQVREFLLETQRRIARENSVVMDGRDIGTVILPDADVKIFLSASNEERARRRCEELRAKGIEASYEEVLADMNERDANDKNREVAPAVAAPDAIHLDNSSLTLDETYEAAMKIIKEKAGDKLPKAETEKKKITNKRSMSGFYRFMWHIFHGFFKVIFNTKIHGAENEPDADYGAMLVCSNHISATDPIVIGLSMRRHQACFMAKKELFRIPLFAQLIKMLGAFPVDRKKSDVGAVRHTIKILEGGGWAAMFPQGTRHPGENPRETTLKNGAGMICAHTKVDVLPVFISTKNATHKLFRRKNIIIGKPIKFEEFGYEEGKPGEYARISAEIFDRVCTLGEEWEKANNEK